MSQAALTAQAVADLVGGRLSGNGATLLTGVASLEAAGPGDLSLLSSPRYLAGLARSRAGCVLVGPGLADGAEGPQTRILVADPQRAIAAVIPRLYPELPPAPGVHPTAVIAPGARLAEGVAVGPMVVIGEAAVVGRGTSLGPGTVIEPGAVIGEDCRVGARVVIGSAARLGNRVRVKAGAVLGGYGFGYLSGPAGHEPVPHTGRCLIADDVDIGANSCVDRGSLGDTVIGRGTRLDNLVHVAHNVRIGEHCLLMAGVMIAGSTRVGSRVILAGQAGVVDHVELGDDVRVGAQSGVIGSVPAGEEVSGFPARNHREYLRAQGALYRLAPVARALERLARTRDADA